MIFVMAVTSYSITYQQELIGLYPHQPLRGQYALVTGASSGIGEGCARHLAAAGAGVVINYAHNKDDADDIASQINHADGRAIVIEADVSDEEQVIEMVRRSVEEFGTLDILVANAGVQQDSKLEDMTEEQWDTVMDINAKGQFLCIREVVKEFNRRGMRSVSKALGKIICTSSVHEVMPWGCHVNYCASKGAVKLMMQSVAHEVSDRGIRVNSIAPGAIKTHINHSSWEDPEAERKLAESIPYRRVGIPDDIGQACVWLASDASDYVVGTTLFVDGGMTLGGNSG